MKKLVFIAMFIASVTLLFSLPGDTDETKLRTVQFSGLAFSNITTFDSGRSDNDQLFGWYTSTLKERPWGETHSKFAIMYNFSAQNTDGVIGIPFPQGETIQNLNSNSLYFPTQRGYTFSSTVSDNAEFLITPTIGFGVFWTLLDYNTTELITAPDPADPDVLQYSEYTGYMLGFDMGLGLDIAMIHKFSDVYFRYGLELNIPMFQLSTSRMTKNISDDGVYYGQDLKAKSKHDFYSIADIFKFEVTPYISIGILVDSVFDSFYFESSKEEEVAAVYY